MTFLCVRGVCLLAFSFMSQSNSYSLINSHTHMHAFLSLGTPIVHLVSTELNSWNPIANFYPRFPLLNRPPPSFLLSTEGKKIKSPLETSNTPHLPYPPLSLLQHLLTTLVYPASQPHPHPNGPSSKLRRPLLLAFTFSMTSTPKAQRLLCLSTAYQRWQRLPPMPGCT